MTESGLKEQIKENLDPALQDSDFILSVIIKITPQFSSFHNTKELVSKVWDLLDILRVIFNYLNTDISFTLLS
jgi:hypothetical protein